MVAVDGELIKRKRLDLGLSRVKVTELTGRYEYPLHERTLLRAENEGICSESSAIRIAEALGLDLADVLVDDAGPAGRAYTKLGQIPASRHRARPRPPGQSRKKKPPAR